MLRVRLIATLVALFVLAAPVAAAPAPKPGEDDRPWSNTQPLTPPPAAGDVDAAALVFPATLTGTPSAKIPAFDGGSSFLCDATDCRSLVYRGTTYQLHTVSGSGVMTVATVAGLTGADTIYYETMTRFGTTLIAFGFRMVGETPGYGIYRSIDKGLTWTFAEKFDADDYVYASRCLSATVCLLPVAEVDAATETLVYAIYRTADKGATWTKLSMPASFADLSGVTTFECIPGTGCLMIATTTDAGTGDDVVRAFTSSAAATSWVAVNTLPAALDGADHILCDGTACAAIHVVSVEDYSAYGHYEIYVATTSFSTWTKRPDIATEQYYPYIMETTCSPILCAFTTDDPMAVRAAGASGTWTADTTATDLTKATDGSAIYSCNATFCVTYRGPRVERMTAPRTTPVQTLVAATISLWNETWSCADALAAAPFCAMSWMTPDWKMAAARSTDGFGTMETNAAVCA